ncbi:hypothetical protein K9L97_01430 [Candidatus Woesearchaeota archaeon]|nr:hypothetical protein [Candidatus Woesearchaeota archaeon]
MNDNIAYAEAKTYASFKNIMDLLLPQNKYYSKAYESEFKEPTKALAEYYLSQAFNKNSVF